MGQFLTSMRQGLLTELNTPGRIAWWLKVPSYINFYGKIQVNSSFARNFSFPSAGREEGGSDRIDMLLCSLQFDDFCVASLIATSGILKPALLCAT